MKIHQFTDDHALTEKFIRFGVDHYRGDGNWIAPFKSSMREQLSPSYRFCLK